MYLDIKIKYYFRWQLIPSFSKMSKSKTPVPYFDYRKKISNPSQMKQLELLCSQWGLSMSDVCWRLITTGIQNEKKRREEISDLSKNNRDY